MRERLRAALRDAIRARDSNALSAFRSALSAIANAEAVAPEAGSTARPKVGVGAGEVARRHLSDADLIRIIAREIAEREDAAAEYERLGRAEQASELRGQADLLRAFIRVRRSTEGGIL